MRIERRIATWVTAGVLSPDAAARIVAYEQARRRPTLLWAFAGLGALAVAIGVVSVVAANWERIAPEAKLVIDFLWGGVLAAGIVVAERRCAALWREVLLVVFWGYVLASISLIAQVYNLSSEPYRGLLAWSLATTPLMLGVRSRIGAAFFVIGWLVTAASLFEVAWAGGWALVVFPSLPFGLLLAGEAWRRHGDSALAWALRRAAWSGVIGGATVLPFAWYWGVHQRIGEAGLGVAAAGSLAAVYLVLFAAPGARLRLAGFFATAIVLSLVPFVYGEEVHLVGAMSFLAVWVWLAFLAHADGKPVLYNMAILLLGARILVIYFEVFGSLLSTGIGLILGGALVLLLGWLYRRWSMRRGGSPPTGGPLAGGGLS